MTKNIALLAAGLLLAISLFACFEVSQAQSQIRQQDPVLRSSIRSSSTEFEYAVLSLLDDGNMQFHAGETSVLPRSFPLEVLYRRLGGRFRGNLPNLLNVIGQDRWELVTFDDANWTFKRPRDSQTN